MGAENYNFPSPERTRVRRCGRAYFNGSEKNSIQRNNASVKMFENVVSAQKKILAKTFV